MMRGENYRRAKRNVELLRLRLNQGRARAGHLTWIMMMIMVLLVMMIMILMVMMMKWYDNMMITRGEIVHNMVTPLPRASHLPPVRISPDPEISDFVETPNFLTPLDFLASPSWYPSTPWFLRKLLSLVSKSCRCLSSSKYPTLECTTHLFLISWFSLFQTIFFKSTSFISRTWKNKQINFENNTEIKEFMLMRWLLEWWWKWLWTGPVREKRVWRNVAPS